MRSFFVLLLALTLFLQPSDCAAQGNIFKRGGADGEITASDIIGDTGAPYENYFKNQRVGGTIIRPKVGPGEATVQAIPQFGLDNGWNAPFLKRGFDPNDAFLRLGILYIDVNPVTFSVFYTDNANRSQSNRQQETIGVFRIGINALIQYTEGFQFSTSGNFIYLPFSNDVGIDGFGIVDTLAARFRLDGGGSPFSTFVAYDATVDNWDLRLSDQFEVNFLSGFLGLRGEFVDELIIAEPRSFQPDVDYFRGANLGGLGSARTTLGRSRGALDSGTSITTDSLVLQNTATAQASKQVVTQTRVTAALTHYNTWYAASNLPSVAEDTATVSAINERENMRFKPFASYTVTKRSTVSNIEQVAGGGLFGPITDYIDFLGSAGWAKAGQTESERFLWRLVLNHDISPLTSHQAVYNRQLTTAQPNRDVATGYLYRINQVLGPRLTGQVFYRKREIEDLDGLQPPQDETTVGIRLNYALSERTNMTLQGTRSTETQGAPANREELLYALRYILSHQLSDTASLSFIYSHENQKAGTNGRSYHENLIGVSLTKRL